MSNPERSEPNSAPSGERSNDTEKKDSFLKFNHRYMTICLYGLGFITIGALIIRAIFSWSQVAASFKAVINILMPFLVGALIAYILNPLYNRLRWLFSQIKKIRGSKIVNALSLLCTYLIVFGACFLIISYILPQIIENLIDLTKKAPDLYDQIYDFLYNFEQSYPDVDIEYLTSVFKNLEPTILGYIKDIASNAVPVLYSASISVIGFVVNALITIMVSIYMLADKTNLKRILRRVFYTITPKEKIKSYAKIINDCNRILNGFIIGKSIDSLIIGVICLIAMNILKLDYRVLISVIVGITNMIPYFGPWIGAIPGILILLFVDPVQSLIFAILIIIIQQFDGLILGPKILGDSTGLKPLWIIFAITIGGSIAGIAGMFFGVPVVAVLSYLFNMYIDEKLKKKDMLL